ncbi:MAG: hypothetical protein MUP24_14885 [Gillisia sp.]|nr:hypothetical protein [Gillisia sp.]
MKKLSLLLLATDFTLSIYSCRETTEEKTEDAVEAVEKATEESVDAVEEATEESVEAVEGTEDVDADQE